MPTERIIELLLGNLGALMLMILLVLAISKGWLVPGWYARELREPDPVRRLEAEPELSDEEMDLLADLVDASELEAATGAAES